MPQIEKLKDVRLRYVRQVMKATRGDEEEAARILGMPIDTLQRLLRQYGLSSEEFRKERGEPSNNGEQ
jgi:DNA-binding NtrC family response regulator